MHNIREAAVTDPSETHVSQFLRLHRGGERLIVLFAWFTIIIGVVYALFELKLNRRLKDLAFLILLGAATAFLAAAVIFFKRMACNAVILICRSEASRSPQDMDYPVIPRHTWRYRLHTWRHGVQTAAQFLRLVFDRKAMCCCAIVYGTLIGSAPLLLRLHPDHILLRVLLAIFLFTANAIAGAALYALVMVLRQMWHFAQHIEITFFVRTTPAVRAYSGMLTTIAVIGAIYISLCQVSAAFSDFGGVWVIGYALFSIVLYIMMYYVPQIPIRQRLVAERDVVLNQINVVKGRLIQGEMNSQSIDDLATIHETEDRILRMGLGLSRTNASFVQLIAVLSGLIPIISVFANALAAFFSQ